MRNAWRGRKAIGVSYTRFVPGFINLPLRIGLNPQGNSAPKFVGVVVVALLSGLPRDYTYPSGAGQFLVEINGGNARDRANPGAACQCHVIWTDDHG